MVVPEGGKSTKTAQDAHGPLLEWCGKCVAQAVSDRDMPVGTNLFICILFKVAGAHGSCFLRGLRE